MNGFHTIKGTGKTSPTRLVKCSAEDGGTIMVSSPNGKREDARLWTDFIQMTYRRSSPSTFVTGNSIFTALRDGIRNQTELMCTVLNVEVFGLGNHALQLMMRH
jgi:hypothetical protein